MEKDTSRRVIQSGLLQYNQFPLCSLPPQQKDKQEKFSGVKNRVHFLKNHLNCTTMEDYEVVAVRRKNTNVLLSIPKGNGCQAA